MNVLFILQISKDPFTFAVKVASELERATETKITARRICRKFKSASFMLVLRGEKRLLIRIDNIMTKEVDLDILKMNLPLYAQNLRLEGRYFFQQDNDCKHTSYLLREWLLCNKPHMLKTPPQSPDINPIEHIWNEKN